MSHNIAPSSGFSDKTLAGVQIEELYYRRLSLEISKIHCVFMKFKQKIILPWRMSYRIYRE